MYVANTKNTVVVRSTEYAADLRRSPLAGTQELHLLFDDMMSAARVMTAIGSSGIIFLQVPATSISAASTTAFYFETSERSLPSVERVVICWALQLACKTRTW